MATITQVPTNGTGALSKDAVPILVTYPDKPAPATTMEMATVSPAMVDRDKNKGPDTTVYFHTNSPGKVRIVFLSPAGNETDSVADSEPYTLARGGFYHFNCYFTPFEGAKESTEPIGGTLDVVPHKP
jgi:hypothetical protein